MKLTLRIWLLGISSNDSDCCKWDLSGDAEGEAWEWTGGGGILSFEEELEDPIPAFIAAKTSPFSRVPRGPDAFSVDASNPNSVISNFADGLILVKLDFSALTSFLDSCCCGFSFLISEPLLTLAFTISMSSGSSTLQKSRY